jgi:hypothetical protein
MSAASARQKTIIFNSLKAMRGFALIPKNIAMASAIGSLLPLVKQVDAERTQNSAANSQKQMP